MKKFLSVVTTLALVSIIAAGVTLTVLEYLNSSQINTPTDEFIVDVNARLAGTNDEWAKELNAPAGSEVELLLNYSNVSDKVQLGVSLWADLPEGLEYIENSTRLVNADYPDGVTVAQNTIVSDGLNIGSYVGTTDDKPGATATVCLTVKIPESLPVTTSLTPAFRVNASNHTNTSDATITIVEEIDPTQSISKRPADYDIDEPEPEAEAETEANAGAESSTDTTVTPEGMI